ncbi:MAG: hypothetical protein IJ466_08720 [Clostridia bacterium]|nr:hypothetical protein [Clostridia bacterium]
MKLFQKCVSPPLKQKKPGQETAQGSSGQEKRYRDYSHLITTFGLSGVAVIMVFSMVMIALGVDSESLIALIGFGSAAGIFFFKHYMRRAAQKDNLEQRRKYGAEIYNDANVPVNDE